MKKLLLGALIAAITVPALATDYFLVVPSKGRVASTANISVALNAGTLPIAAIGVPYTYDFSKSLVVTGDPKYANTGVTWALTQGTLPAGLALDAKSGIVQGTPSSVGSSSVTLQATYKTKAGSQQYVVTIGAAKFDVVTAPATTDFGASNVNTASTTTLSFDVSNSGNVAGSLPVPQMGGANPADFSAASTCSNIAVSGKCKVSVGFTPTAAGARTASLALAGQTYTFSGTGNLAGADPYFANVSLLMHMDGVDGGTSFPDVKGNTFKSNSNLTTTKSAGKFNGALYSPSNASAYVSGAANGALAFGTADYTVETWVFFSDPPQGYHQFMVASSAATGNFQLVRFYTTGAIRYGFNGVGSSSIAPSLNTWHHLAVSRVSGVTRLFIDGKFDSQFTDTNNYADTNVVIGGLATTTGRELSGMLDEVRVTKGVGRYTTTNLPNQTKPWPDY